jgi:hypothetical protein
MLLFICLLKWILDCLWKVTLRSKRVIGGSCISSRTIYGFILCIAFELHVETTVSCQLTILELLGAISRTVVLALLVRHRGLLSATMY